MNQLPDIPELEIVSTLSLQPHEEIDKGRSDRLIRALQTVGFLKNPPVVLRLSADQERYVVLDGANRTTAFRDMGFPHILVQIAGEGVEVKSWNHALLGGRAEGLVEGVRELEGVELRRSDPERAGKAIRVRQAIAYLALANGDIWQLETGSASVPEQLDCLSGLVSLYQGQFRRERTNATNLNGLTRLFPDLSCLIVYPRFQVQDVIEVASSGRLFPSGLTRFLISPRALRVNFPLAMLADRSPVEAKREVLKEWIRTRLDQRRVRYYAESTFLFDE